MSAIPRRMAEAVFQRANHRCEYCQLSQKGQEATFHVDHVKPRIVGGTTELENLALACVSCSLRKWAKETNSDPMTGLDTPLFNPRTQVWNEHFCWEAEVVVPLTAIGRATTSCLALNRSFILEIRREEMLRGRHPPPSKQT